ncbi:MAG: rod shape-determining protein MreD [Bacilli bacterium]|nr:rod shape-determining protein MreD [Bacilli bacterium]
MTSLIITISFVIDYYLSLYLPYEKNSLSYLTPLFIPILIYLLYPLFKNKKTYILVSIIIGIVYDLIYTNLLYFNGIIFLFISLITILIYKYFKNNIYLNIIYLLLIIIFYELVSVLLFIIFGVISVSIYEVFYKITHTIIINLIYGTTIYIVINHKR